jgi:hypothetical protein
MTEYRPSLYCIPHLIVLLITGLSSMPSLYDSEEILSTSTTDFVCGCKMPLLRSLGLPSQSNNADPVSSQVK